MSRKNIDEDELKDSYAEKLKRLINKKRKSRRAVVEIEVDEDEEHGNVIDLVAVFKERMRQAESADEPDEESSGEAMNLNHLNKEELYERAKARNIPGRGKMSKQQLIKALAA